MRRPFFSQARVRPAARSPRVLALCALTLAAAGCEEGVFIGGAGGGNPTSADGGGDGAGGDGGGGGGTTSSTSSTTTDDPLFPDPPEGSFPCGDGYCMAATHYCVEDVDGPCCGSSTFCVPLPSICDTFGTICACILDQECPCGGEPGSCNPGVEATCEQPETSGPVLLTCLNP